VDGQQALRVDLAERQIVAGPGKYWPFEIADHARTRLMEGLDDVGLTLKHREAIEAWELRTAQEMPFLQACPVIAAP
jgi:3-isopropylmalate/(R)-2-methylmalate dehydratase small subunit